MDEQGPAYRYVTVNTSTSTKSVTSSVLLSIVRDNSFWCERFKVYKAKLTIGSHVNASIRVQSPAWLGHNGPHSLQISVKTSVLLRISNVLLVSRKHFCCSPHSHCFQLFCFDGLLFVPILYCSVTGFLYFMFDYALKITLAVLFWPGHP